MKGAIECRRVRGGVHLTLLLPESFYQLYATEDNVERRAKMEKIVGSDVGRVLVQLYKIEVETIFGKVPKVTRGAYDPEKED